MMAVSFLFFFFFREVWRFETPYTEEKKPPFFFFAEWVGEWVGG